MEPTILDKIDHFFEDFPRVRLRKGQAVPAAEQDNPDIFWIERGMIRMYQITDDGSELTLHIFRAPSFFPMMLYLSHRPSSYYFQTVDEVIARKAPGKAVEQFLKQNNDVLFDLTTRFADGITGLLLRIEELAAPRAKQRLIPLLLYLAKTFGQQDGARYTIDLQLSHDDLAAWIGSARETVSRQLEKLEKDGLVVKQARHLVILDVKALKKQLE
jgi:CRP-like cAMP-binding protein